MFSNPPGHLSKTRPELHFQIRTILTAQSTPLLTTYMYCQEIYESTHMSNMTGFEPHTPKTFKAVPFQRQIILLVAISLLKGLADIPTNDACRHYGKSVNCLLPCLMCTFVPSL